MTDIEETPIELLDDYYSEKKIKKSKEIDWKLLTICILFLFIIVLLIYIIRSKN